MLTWLKHIWSKITAYWRCSRQRWPKTRQAMTLVASLILAGLLGSLIVSVVKLLLPVLLVAGFVALWLLILARLAPETAVPGEA